MNEHTILEIASVCYEANRAYCEAMGDNSFKPWEDAEDWQKVTNINGVKFQIANPDSTPADSHGSWLAEKLADGWKYGPVKDPIKKEHPCFVPYSELAVEQRAKDYIFQGVARRLIEIYS